MRTVHVRLAPLKTEKHRSIPALSKLLLHSIKYNLYQTLGAPKTNGNPGKINIKKI